MYAGAALDAVELVPFLGGVVAVFSRNAPDKQSGNEDAAVLVPFDADSGILAVADGLGGNRGGGQASSTTVYEMCASLELGKAQGSSLREAVLDGMENANREVAALGIGAATTLAVAELRGALLRPYHVGDSEILVVGRRGKVKLQTVSHSPMGYAVESGLLDAREALLHEDRHFVFNVVGVPDMRIEVGAAIELAPLDTVLVACDGLFDNLAQDEIVAFLCLPDLRQAVEALIGACRERMAEAVPGSPHKPDDLTVLVWRREGEG